jgi:hypothetical protein
VESHIDAHLCSSRHRSLLMKSELCGCFHGLETFPPDDIRDWLDGGDTALCPKCSIDSVIGFSFGCPINREFLAKMHDHWF